MKTHFVVVAAALMSLNSYAADCIVPKDTKLERSQLILECVKKGQDANLSYEDLQIALMAAVVNAEKDIAYLRGGVDFSKKKSDYLKAEVYQTEIEKVEIELEKLNSKIELIIKSRKLQ